jgi:hypothetical protein
MSGLKILGERYQGLSVPSPSDEDEKLHSDFPKFLLSSICGPDFFASIEFSLSSSIVHLVQSPLLKEELGPLLFHPTWKVD